METISISPKFQVVIPKTIREALGLVAGQKMQALRYGDRVELIPLRPLAQARGFLAGIDSHVERDADRA
jgi:AbrB family looped-hinge helix DNA binding protein